jgi:hypothetical protein
MITLAEIFSVDPFSDRTRSGSGAAFLVLMAFLLAFLFIRTSARMTRSVSWWPGGVETDGMHLHHLVWGIVLMALCGFLGFAIPLQTPWWHLVAIGFGVGVGLTLDEFALWVHLEDVYWTEQGRASLDAVVCATVFAALVVIGTQPFGLNEPASVLGTAAIVVVCLSLSIICFAKGRVALGVFGLFIPLVSLYGVVTLGRPESPWSKWRYDDDKRRRAQERFADDRPLVRLRRRLADMIAGAPSPPSAPDE